VKLLASVAILGVLTAAALPASAYCRTSIDDKFVQTAAKPCDDKLKVSWATRCMGFSVQTNASKQLDLASAQKLAEGAFAEWHAHDCQECGAGAMGKPSLASQDVGPVACDQVEFNQGKDRGNANVVIFRDGAWPHSGVALALTTITYRVDTGEIYDGDIEVQSNPTEIKLAVGDTVNPGEYDLRSILTHEAGHFYGLAHSTDPTATMFASYRAGQSFMRDLSKDDVCGICDVYPPNRAAACDSAPRGGLVSECGGDKGCGCSVPGGDASRAGAGLSVFALLLGLARRKGARACAPGRAP